MCQLRGLVEWRLYTKAYFKISLSTTILAYFIKKGYPNILKNYNHIFVAVGIELRALNILGSILPLSHIASPGITVKEACAKEITWWDRNPENVEEPDFLF